LKQNQHGTEASQFIQLATAAKFQNYNFRFVCRLPMAVSFSLPLPFLSEVSW
jgi:hypothetical protein